MNRAQLPAETFGLLDDPRTCPRAGDVVVARVVEIGQHKRLEGPGGRRALLFPGDEILVAFGHRYAPDQFEAEVPVTLDEPTHLAAAGGIAGTVTAALDGLEPPTRLESLGLLADSEGAVTLGRYAPRRVRPGLAPAVLVTDAKMKAAPRVVAVLGTSMNSGKSTPLASLVRGLTQADLRVAAGKATGTGAGGDPGMFVDAGASAVLDFTDFGYPSTYRLPPAEVRDLFCSLVVELSADGPDVVIVEIADGLHQRETAALLADPVLRHILDRVVFAATDALNAQAGLEALRAIGLPVAAVSGRLTASPLATREALASLDVPVIVTEMLTSPDVARALVPDLVRGRVAS